jgi:hypothetical protein
VHEWQLVAEWMVANSDELLERRGVSFFLLASTFKAHRPTT